MKCMDPFYKRKIALGQIQTEDQMWYTEIKKAEVTKDGQISTTKKFIVTVACIKCGQQDTYRITSGCFSYDNKRPSKCPACGFDGKK